VIFFFRWPQIFSFLSWDLKNVYASGERVLKKFLMMFLLYCW
jgi:hypothetical protein